MSNDSRSNRLRKLSDLLEHAGHDLTALRERAAYIERLTQQVRSRLPASLKSHCISVSLQGDCLVIFTDSPAWSSRLRYLAPELLQELDHPGMDLRTVRVRVTPAGTAAKPATPSRRARMSPSGAETLERTSRSIGDAPLGAALLRLSRHGRRPG